jgi:hypothetical protein
VTGEVNVFAYTAGLQIQREQWLAVFARGGFAIRRSDCDHTYPVPTPLDYKSSGSNGLLFLLAADLQSAAVTATMPILCLHRWITNPAGAI